MVVSSLLFEAGAAGGIRGQARSNLKSLGIDTRGMVVQRGSHNYAGPRCPGKRWTCTTARRVLQVGGDNKVDCTPGTPSILTGTQGCVIVQNGPGRNSARCFERSDSDVIAQDCNITQTGTQNTATIDQAIEANGGPTQSGTQTAEVMQTSTAGKNELTAKQHVHQDVHKFDTQTLDAFQELTSTQTASGTGDNHANVHQDQNQDAHDGLTQSQNTNPTPAGVACFQFPAFAPNQCANITQNADAGDNRNELEQSIDQDEHSNVLADQTQGSFGGGINGHVELSSVTGSSHNEAHQSKSQDAKGAPGSTQTQTDPIGCCGASAQGNTRSRETLDQSSTQNASEGAAAQQFLEIFGVVSSADGSCSITQHATNNSDSSNVPVSLSPCPVLLLTTICMSGSIGEQPTQNAGRCVAFEPEGGGDLTRR